MFAHDSRTAFSVDLPVGRFTLRTVVPSADLDLFHRWMHDPDIARFWNIALSPEELQEYLHDQLTSSLTTPYIGCIDGEPMSYWELYRADVVLAEYYPARPRDAGIHLLLGPAAMRGRGYGTQLLRAVADGQFEAQPYATRLVAEPDVRNAASIRIFEKAGFKRYGEVELPHKMAMLMIRDRS